MNLVVYTTVFGMTDPLREPMDPGKAKFVCFSDREMSSKHWEIRVVPKSETPCRDSRKLKQLSHKVFPEADMTIWADAQFHFRMPPEALVECATHNIMGFRHPDRRRITQEASAIIRAKKGDASTILAQLAAYKADGWDPDRRPQRYITNGGLLLRHNTPEVARFNELWHHEVQTRSLRDQMSIDYCAYKAGVAIGRLPGTVRRNPFVKIYTMIGKSVNDL